MKNKKHKYYEDIVEEYLQLTDEQIEIPVLIEKNKEKLDTLLNGKSGTVLKSSETNDAYKIFMQLKKYEERKTELETELHDVQDLLKQFLKIIDGCKISYKEHDDDDKTKSTYLFWLEEDIIKSNR